MKSENLDNIWNDMEINYLNEGKTLQRLVYRNLIYRVYVGISDIPFRRFVMIEIPEQEAGKFNLFSGADGFEISIVETGVKHDGFVSCLLQSTSSELNDVFTIVISDILNELKIQRSSSSYIEALENRILKWKNFFKNTVHLLSDNQVLGLIGELSFILDALKQGIASITDYWNGPISAAQDIQCDNISIEVKSKSTNKIQKVSISSEEQLDIKDREFLFLVVYQFERNDAHGILLSNIINSIREYLDNKMSLRFDAKLLCLGYKENDSHMYLKGYILKDTITYKVTQSFPKIVSEMLPTGVSNIKYSVNLEQCKEYESVFEDIIITLGEYENDKIN